VPGLIVTQHSGDGKANQYFLRGFNLDHGTDFATTTVSGMPVNMPTHGHGQGYSDLNFLIPELVERIDYRKGRTSRATAISRPPARPTSPTAPAWMSPWCSSRWASAATSVWSRAARRRWPGARPCWPWPRPSTTTPLDAGRASAQEQCGADAVRRHARARLQRQRDGL
jgi:hypothetical protein